MSPPAYRPRQSPHPPDSGLPFGSAHRSSGRLPATSLPSGANATAGHRLPLMTICPVSISTSARSEPPRAKKRPSGENAIDMSSLSRGTGEPRSGRRGATGSRLRLGTGGEVSAVGREREAANSLRVCLERPARPALPLHTSRSHTTTRPLSPATAARAPSGAMAHRAQAARRPTRMTARTPMSQCPTCGPRLPCSP